MEALHNVRAVALTDYPSVAASVGLEPTAMLDRVGLAAGMLISSETRLPAEIVSNLLEVSAEVSGCECFGLLMAERRSFESLGQVVDIIKPLASLREIIGATNSVRRRLNDVFELEIRQEGSGAELLLVKVLPQFSGRQALYLVTAMTHVLLRGASYGAWKPKAVHFPPPAPGDISAFERFFGAPVTFDRATCAFECEAGILDRRHRDDPVVAASELVSILENKIMSLPASDHSKVEELKQLLASIRLQLQKTTGGLD